MEQLGKATVAQKTRIQIARKALQLSDDAYYGLLSGYGVDSSRDLSYKDANKVIVKLKKLGWKEEFKPRRLVQNEERGFSRSKYSHLTGRDPELASPAQLRMIEGMWRQVSRKKHDESLQSFIRRITGIDNIEWISKKNVTQLKAAMEAMDRQLQKRKDGNDKS